MNTGLWVLIAVVVVVAIVAAFVVVRMRQRSGTIVAARPRGRSAGGPSDGRDDR